MYEKCKKKELDVMKSNAILFSNALVYTSQSNDSSQVRRKQSMWKSFIDSLSWDKLVQNKEKVSPKNIINVFKGLGIPVKGKKKGD